MQTPYGRQVHSRPGCVAAVESKPVVYEGGDHVASREITEQPVVDLHESDGYCDAGFDGHLHLIARLLRDMFPVLKHAFDNHPDNIIDMAQGL
jgi:hypothetical protein